MDKLRRALSGDESNNEPDEEGGLASQLRDATTLGWTSRIKWFAITFILGFVFSILGVFFIAIRMKLFALFYSIGNICSISSTCFLMGPWKQMKKMFHPTRVVATITALSFLVLTLVVAFKLQKTGLTLICCIVQFLAMTWYSLSYIPYGREAVLKVINI